MPRKLTNREVRDLHRALSFVNLSRLDKWSRGKLVRLLYSLERENVSIARFTEVLYAKFGGKVSIENGYKKFSRPEPPDKKGATDKDYEDYNERLKQMDDTMWEFLSQQSDVSIPSPIFKAEEYQELFETNNPIFVTLEDLLVG